MFKVDNVLHFFSNVFLFDFEQVNVFYYVKKVLVVFIFETLSCVQKKLGPSLFLGLIEVVIHVL